MARRGQFGRYNPGASNLSSMISSLVAQQKSAEESLLIRQFRNGEKTYADIAAFYDNWAQAAGLEPGDPGYETIAQNKSDLYNESLVMTENSLWSTFTTTNGSNYTELMQFLNGDAMTSTNQNDKQKFAELKKSATNNYIAYAADLLKKGEITVDQFKANLDANLAQAFDPGSQEFKDAQLNGMIVEYGAEISKWDKRQQAGLPNAISGTKEFIKKFQDQLIAAGVDRNSDIFLTTLVDLKNTNARGVAGAVDSSYARAAGAEKKLSKVFSAAARAAGIALPPITAQDMLKGKTHYDVNDFINNSEVFAALNKMVVSGQIDMPQELIDLGINNLSQFNNVVDNTTQRIATNYAAANAANPTQTGAILAGSGRALRQSVGTRTGAEEIKYAASQFQEDFQNATRMNDTVAQQKAKNEWQSYLNGGPSIYGTLPPASMLPGVLGKSYAMGIESSKAGLAGTPDGQVGIEDMLGLPPLQVLTADGTQQQVSYTDLYNSPTLINMSGEVEALRAGAMVDVVNPDGTHSVQLASAASAGGKIGNTNAASKSGYLNVLVFKDLGGGRLEPFIQSIKSTAQIAIAQGTNTTMDNWGYQYNLTDGTKLYVKGDGAAYLGWPFDSPQTTGGGNILAPLSTSISPNITKEDSLPQIDFTSLMAGNDYATFRNNIEEAKKNLAANPLMLQVLGISPNQPIDVNLLFAPAVKKADQIELKDINSKLQLLTRDTSYGVTQSVQQEIDRLSSRVAFIEQGNGQAMTSVYDSSIAPNLDKMERLPNGTYKISDAAKKAAGLIDAPIYSTMPSGYGVMQVGTQKVAAPVLGKDGTPLEDIIYDPRPISIIRAEQNQNAFASYNQMNFGTATPNLNPFAPAPTVTPTSRAAAPSATAGITPAPRPTVSSGISPVSASEARMLYANPVTNEPVTQARLDVLVPRGTDRIAK
jgi:hypothetical protein